MSLAKTNSPKRYVLPCLFVFVSLSIYIPIALGQTAATSPTVSDAQSSPKSSDVLNPALDQVSQAMAGLNISRWKAPSEVKQATQQNVDSILRDLHNTLPGLLTQADAAPNSVSAVFPVYRNVDALYDVLLRVSETANLAAPQNEASSIGSALSQLESARSNLGGAIFSAAKNNEADVVKLHSTIAQMTAAAAQPPAPAKTTVVNDGPAKATTPVKKKKKPATPPPAPAATTPAGNTPQPQQ